MPLTLGTCHCNEMTISLKKNIEYILERITKNFLYIFKCRRYCSTEILNVRNPDNMWIMRNM